MKTLVKFLKNDDEVFAFFPAHNYNKAMYGNSQKMSYSHIGQHSACHIDYAAESIDATPEEYKDLEAELIGIGYELVIINKNQAKKYLSVMVTGKEGRVFANPLKLNEASLIPKILADNESITATLVTCSPDQYKAIFG